MGRTSIEWTATRHPDGTTTPGYTFNPWVGCAKISPACTSCYAETWAKRAGNPELWRGARRRTSAANWRKPLMWQRQHPGARVFCASLADVFEHTGDPEVADAMDDWRADLWELIESTPALVWMLLTKRPENVLGSVPPSWLGRCQQCGEVGATRCPSCPVVRCPDCMREHDIDGIRPGVPCPDPYARGDRPAWPSHVWLGTTVEDQARADARIPSLLEVPAMVRFLSCEPLLGPVEVFEVCDRCHGEPHIEPDTNAAVCSGCDGGGYASNGIDWVIVGSESGSRRRPTDLAWVRSLRDQCAGAGVSFFAKQLDLGEGLVSAPVLDGRQHLEVPS